MLAYGWMIDIARQWYINYVVELYFYATLKRINDISKISHREKEPKLQESNNQTTPQITRSGGDEISIANEKDVINSNIIKLKIDCLLYHNT